MSYATYFIVRQILMALILYLGLHMLFMKLSDSVRGSFYAHSLRLMGFAFLIVPASCFIYTKENQLDLVRNVATIINMIAYFSTFILMCQAFLKLLGMRLHRWHYAVSVAFIICFALPLLFVMKYGSAARIEMAITAAYTYFVFMIILLVSIILYRYRQAKQSLENYFSDDLSICVKWISDSMCLLIGLAVLCLCAPFFLDFPRRLRFVFMIYGVICYMYIHQGYSRMLINLTEYFVKNNASVSHLADVEHMRGEKGVLSKVVESGIEEHIAEWISSKCFVQCGITINDVAKQSRTNRTYLSKYINTKYKCSFRAWITSLRIEEAKRLLIEKKDVSVTNISEQVGFASVESFSHIFTRQSGMSPTRWRDEGEVINETN